MKHTPLLSSLLAAALAACSVPDDALFDPPVVEPVDEGGVLRLTFNPGPDVVRGFGPDGRVVYWSRGLPPSGSGSALLSLAPTGGAAAEEVAIYRQGLIDEVRQLVFDAGGRVLATWKTPTEKVHGCGPPAPTPPTGVVLGIYRLGVQDGAPLSTTPTRSVDLPVIEGAATSSQTVRITPAEAEIRARGVDPYGPSLSADGSVAVYSDGDALWRFDPGDSQAPADSVGPGAFPAVSPDGTLLAAAIPAVLDTITGSISVPGAFGDCTQTTIELVAQGWQVVLYDLATGAASDLGPGLEPRFDPAGARLLVRREALYWVPIGGGPGELVPGTGGAFAPAISPAGAVAFSRGNSPDHNVYLLPVGGN